MRLTVVLLPVILLAYTCNQEGSGETSDHTQTPTASLSTVTPKDTVVTVIDFNAEIVPIFKARCSPCHFPGGKMYSKMPFDSARTITGHREGILRRIKDPAESKKIRDFIELDSKR